MPKENGSTMNELPTTVAAATLAKLLGLSTRRIQQLVEAGVIPKPGKRGEYKLVESVAGYLKWLRSDAGNGTPDFQKERARLTAARARLAEIAADRESGLVVEVEELNSPNQRGIFNRPQQAVGHPVEGRTALAEHGKPGEGASASGR